MTIVIGGRKTTGGPVCIERDLSFEPQRYDEAVTMIAAANPLLAYNIRSKDLILPYFQAMRQLAAEEADQGAAYAQVERLVAGPILARLDADILRLGRHYSWLTWFHLWRLLRKKEEAMTEEVKRFLEEVQRQAT